MAHKKQAKKRIRQNEKHRKANRELKSAIRTYSRNVAEAVARNDRAAAEEALNLACQKLDKAAKHNVFHPNNAARKKSRLAKQVNSLPK
ncbi:MAG: 30S ribosomal protein S20 [Planctomycetota bacterium]|nr:MAG: 30S ribosomal protein S20 [Planctomycetota bacterium]